MEMKKSYRISSTPRLELAQSSSYRCTFCKRNFSNAQALGGHMNIHRKDRAIQKGFSDTSTIPLQISSSPSDESLILLESSCHGHDHDLRKNCVHKTPWSCFEEDEDIDDHHHRRNINLKKLGKFPLLVEKPSARSVDEKLMKHGSSASFELDLELRLGREPQD